jgi:hypothetical protein
MLRNLALATSLAVAAAPAVAYAAPAAPVAAHTVKVAAPAQASSTDAKSYADREAQSQKAGDFRGGDAVVIGVSGGAIVVLLILLLILA